MVDPGGDSEEQDIINTVEVKGALYTCSHEKKVEAMKLAAR